MRLRIYTLVVSAIGLLVGGLALMVAWCLVFVVALACRLCISGGSFMGKGREPLPGKCRYMGKGREPLPGKCRYIAKNVSDCDWKYCGKPTPAPSDPWCEEHRKIVYLPH